MIAYSNEVISSKSVLPTLTTIDLTASQYKNTLEEMSVEMFNIHTSLLTANKEISRFTSKNEKLTKKNEELELSLIGLEGPKEDNEYLKEKLDYTE